MRIIIYIFFVAVNIPFIISNPANWFNAVAAGFCGGLLFQALAEKFYFN